MGLKDDLIRKSKNNGFNGAKERQAQRERTAAVEQPEESLDSLYDDPVGSVSTGDDLDLSYVLEDDGLEETPISIPEMDATDDLEAPAPQPVMPPEEPSIEDVYSQPLPQQMPVQSAPAYQPAPQPDPRPAPQHIQEPVYQEQIYQEPVYQQIPPEPPAGNIREYDTGVDSRTLEDKLLDLAKQTILTDIVGGGGFKSDIVTEKALAGLVDAYLDGGDWPYTNGSVVLTSVVDEIISGDYTNEFYKELTDSVLLSVKDDLARA